MEAARLDVGRLDFASHFKVIDAQSSDSQISDDQRSKFSVENRCAFDREASDRDRADGESADRERTDRKRSNRHRYSWLGSFHRITYFSSGRLHPRLDLAFFH